MYKVGIVGPRRSVERILHYAKEFECNLSFAGYSYNIVNETTDILEKHHAHVDFWLFSGYIPYKIAQQSRHFSKERMEYIFITGNTFYRGVLEISHEIGRLAKSVSIDVLHVPEDNFFEEIIDLDKILDHVYIKRFTAKTSIDEIIEHHVALWKEQKIDCVITVYPKVEEKLKEIGIPVGLVVPHTQDIYHTLQLLSEKIQTIYYKKTQTTALVVQIKSFDYIKMANQNGYRIHFLQLEMKKIVLQICEKIDGYLIEESNGRFVLFSSRGIVERNINAISEMIDRLSSETEQPVVVGIGHASTVYYAENYAHHAMQHLMEKGTKGIVVMEENGEMTEIVQGSSLITYTSRVQDKKIIERLNESSISGKMFAKIEAVMNELKVESFSAKMLAKELNMTERNAQRIISELAKVELIEYCGEENRNSRGRPAKLYKLCKN
ncbi:hypothetical protein RRV45_21790 [Bacillus sp. DTU_2020_1000418_1_SI_GHA_SEK_038]|uniref:hypothetical protein n=1 Tax=Bacillus sp. DTU_2020_1000418_1_SI_GHA_SEK_038 TaxID=3077585 RepID=UPI0028E25A05|nr:hypothetical protein [Bacillus sp. DTU_2020_1000418_1_SI_GHA_SEK_038]WNS75465.1 hypothetical protein RRV45_21790 [Bacillus sp. DTU_2020_1000418_1_SI_GHA_SEK_038]